MSITVEANLKIPSIIIKSINEPVRRIDNGGVRFIKRIAVDAVPKSGNTLLLATGSGGSFDATVTRVEWSESKDLFVVSCTYAKKSISPELYNALVNDEGWKTKMLV